MKRTISVIELIVLFFIFSISLIHCNPVKGAFYKAPQENSPGVILLHGWIRPGSPWHDLSWRLRKQGYTVYAPDLPQVTVSQMLKEVDSHIQYLIGQGVDPNRVALIGESTGANTALWYAGGNSRIKTIILLSPGYRYRIPLSWKEMQQYGTRPVLIITSEYDSEYPSSAQDSQNLFKQAKGRKELKFASGGHGIGMFDSKVFDWIISWLKETL
jgi:dienelactone hydrolase